MMRLLVTIALSSLLGICPLLTVAAEDSGTTENPSIIVSSGREGGGYWSAAARLQAVASDSGFDVAVRPSTGSLDNLEKLTSPNSPVNLALAQADALQFFLDQQPGAAAQLETLESIGQECVFIITDSNSPIHNDTDLQGATNYRLGIGSADSGIAVTFRYMQSQVPELQDIDVSYGDTSAVLGQLQDTAAPADAVMVVHRPREHSPEVDLALRNPDRYRFVEVRDPRLTEQLATAPAVYQAMDLAMPGTDGGVKTICVKGLLLANKEKLGVKQREQLYDLVNSHWMRVYATP